MAGENPEDGEMSLYVIELIPGRDPEAMWYVGITRNPKDRYRHHCNGHGSIWTERNRCVDMHVLLWGGRGLMKRLENRLTLALWDEYGPDTTQGGEYTGEGVTDADIPRGLDSYISPPLAEALEKTGDERLAALSNRSRVYVEIEELLFESVDEVEEWGDEALPEGTELKLSTPDYSMGSFYAEEPSEAENPQLD